MYQIFRKMERKPPDRIRTAAVIADVPLSARSYQFIPETYASEGFYFPTTK